MSTVYTALFFVRGKHQNRSIIVNIYHRPISQLVYHKAPFLRPQGRGIQVYQQNLKKINRNNVTVTNTPMISAYRKTLVLVPSSKRNWWHEGASKLQRADTRY